MFETLLFSGTVQRIKFYLLMNYYLKYCEFVDTLFFVLKKTISKM